MQWFRSCAAGLLLALCVGIAFPDRGQAGEASDWGANFMPNVRVVDQNGRELRFYDDVIKGRIVVISFVYTVCRDMCPMVTARLALLQDKLGDIVGRDIFFVSISIDPVRDTPERLKQFADSFRVGPGWTFLTGTVEDINVIRKKLGERSRKLTEHRSELLLGNDRIGAWGRDSAFADLEVLASNVRDMDPAWLYRHREVLDVMPKPEIAVAEIPGQTLFVKTCGSCHTVGKGQRVGPDLAGLFTRRDRSWIKGYMMKPDVMRAQGDPAALELAKIYRAVRMPNLGLSEDDAADLLQYLELQTANVGTTAAKP